MFGLRDLRESKGIMHYALNLIVAFTFLVSSLGLSYAMPAEADVSMLRQSSASRRLTTTVADIGIDLLRSTYTEGGSKALRALVSDRALDKVEDALEKALIDNGIAVLEKDDKTYIIGVIGNGWRLDLSDPRGEIEPFASVDEQAEFFSGGQLTWLSGEYTPAELIDAQAGAKTYLEDAGRQDRIFVEADLPGQVAKYSATRTSVARQLPPLVTHENPDKDKQKQLVARIQAAFDFHKKAIGSITQDDINGMMPVGLAPVFPIKVGAEGFSLAEGPAVGEITADHLNEIGVKDTIIGHSATRRTELYDRQEGGAFLKVGTQEGDTDEDIKDKLKVALENEYKVTLCVGETLKIREEDGNAVGYVLGQLEAVLGGLNLTRDGVKALLEAVAYEPIWAIGTGVTAELEDIEEMHAEIRNWFTQKYGKDVAQSLPIQYGGSVKADEKTQEIFLLSDVDGALIGGASLKAADFSEIAAIADEVGRTLGKFMLISANWKAEDVSKRDPLLAHLSALESKKLGNTGIRYYLPFTILRESKSLVAEAISQSLDDVRKDIRGVRQAVVLDEADNPSFFFKGEAGSSRFTAVTASSGGYKYDGYSYEAAEGKAPRSIYKILAMIESYMEIAGTDADALRAYRLKLLHEYLEVSGTSKFHRQETPEVVDLINKYDEQALAMWKAREAEKAEKRLAKEEKKVVAEAFSANIAKFLALELDEVVPEALIAIVNEGLQELVEAGLLTDYKVFANAGDIHVVTTRQNRDAVEDDAKILPAIANVLAKAVDSDANTAGFLPGESLSEKSYLEQVRALEIRVPYEPMIYSERAADPFAVLNASNTYVGAFNLLIWHVFSDPMYNAGITIDPNAMRGYIFEVWDTFKDEVYRFDAETENTKLRAVANQPGRYAIVGVYTKSEHKVATDENLIMVTAKRVADNGEAGVGDFSPVVMIRSQSGLPAWGETNSPFGTAMPLLSYGGDKTRGIVAFRPTDINEANGISADARKGQSILTGFGFQSNDNGHFGRTEDVGGHQTMDPTRNNAERWANIFFNEELPPWMDHIIKLEPFNRPHIYDRDDQVVATRERLDARFERNPSLKDGETDPLLTTKGDDAISNIKSDIGSVPGHFKPHVVTIKALNEMLEIGKLYGFHGVDQYRALGELAMVLRTGLTIDEVVSKKGVYRKQDSDALMAKVAEFKSQTTINDWDDAAKFLEAKGLPVSELIAKLKDAEVDYKAFMIAVDVAAKEKAREYFDLTDHRAPTDKEVEVLSVMTGLAAGSAQDLFDEIGGLADALELTANLEDDAKILDFVVWSSGDDCQLTMRHKRLAEDKLIHLLGWNTLWYAADQTSYFKPYGWKQDILVDNLVSGNIQGAGPGYAELQMGEGEDALVFSSDKSAPGAFTVPILGIIRQALADGKFKHGVIAEIWDINNRPRAFFDLSDEAQYADALTLLSSPEEFATKRVWVAVESGGQVITDVAGNERRIDDIPLIAASTERLVLTAGEYVGKDDPTLLVRLSNVENEKLDKGNVIDVFQYPQVTLGFMRGSHVGPLVPGTEPMRFSGKGDPSSGKEATPHLFDGPPPLDGLELVAGQEFGTSKDIFAEMVPWLDRVIEQGNFMTQVLRRQGWNPPHKVEGPDTEYTSWPLVMASIEAEGRAKPASNEQEALFYQSLLALQNEGISHQLSEAVLGNAARADSRKVILIQSSVLRNDPSLILALQSINGQINKRLGVFGSSENIDANHFQFVLIADDASLGSAQAVDDFFAGINEATAGGVRIDKDIFAKILTQDDMYEGKISNSVDLLQQLHRMGLGELVEALVGAESWAVKLKANDDIVVVNVTVEDGTVAFASNALFGAIEALATGDRTLSEPLKEKFDIALLPSGAMTVEETAVKEEVEQDILAYRATVSEI